MSNLWVKDHGSKAMLSVDREAKDKFLKERQKETRILDLEMRVKYLEAQVDTLTKLINRLLD